MQQRRPILITTMGDAAGIGPELVAKSLLRLDATADVKRLILGDRRVFDQGREVAGVVADVPSASDVRSAIDHQAPVVFVDIKAPDVELSAIGRSTRECGSADIALANVLVELHKQQLVHGFVFAPVNKLSLSMGGSKHEGYKALIADLMGQSYTSAEINTLGYLWTTRVTSHCALEDVAALITEANVLDTIRYLHRELTRFGMNRPRIAVSALNPHNGDGGLFGRQEIDAIAPAVLSAQSEGIDAVGPFPADTLFLAVKKQNIPAVVSMYHDQCQIATKLMGFDEGVTYFGGLPFPITTPAHGTAFDIAGKGSASETPMVNALKLAATAAKNAVRAAIL